jgi:hypothetical protein
MPLSSLDIVFYYTGNATGPSNNTLSLGGTISPYTIPDATPNNIWDDVTGDESQFGKTEYRGIAIKDTDPNYSMINPKVWISGFNRAPTGADTIYIARSTFPLNSNTMGICISGNVLSETIPPNESNLNWISEDSQGTQSATIDFSPGTLNPGNWFGLWLKRVVPAGASPFSPRSFTIVVQCETTASPFRHTITKTYSVSWNKGGAISVIQV